MEKIWIIAKKEIVSYFKSPIAYVVMVASISIFNVLFFMIIDQSREASLRDIFKLMEFMFVFMVPILTMKIFAEEKMLGTMEFLQTTPTTNFAIVMGKYLGSLFFFSTMIILTLPYYFIIEIFSAPDRMATFVGYVGVWMESALFIAIGLWTSSWSRNQIISAVSSYAIIFLLYFSISFSKYFSGTALDIIQYLNVLTHTKNFFVGIVTSSDLIYFLSGIFLCLMLTRMSVENRL